MEKPDDEFEELSEESSYFISPIGGQSTDTVGPKEDPNPEGSKAKAFVANSDLVRSVQHGSTPAELMNIVIREAAEDVAYLKYERNRAYREGRNVVNVVSQRTNSLRALVDLIIKKQEGMKSSAIDINSPRFKQVLQLWMEFVYEALVKTGMKQSDIDVVFKTMQADMTDWEKKVIDL